MLGEGGVREGEERRERVTERRGKDTHRERERERERERKRERERERRMREIGCCPPLSFPHLPQINNPLREKTHMVLGC